MSFAANVDWQKLNQALRPVELALDNDLEKLRRTDDRKRAELWNKIESSQNTFENELVSGLAPDLRRELGSKFSLAKLLLAAAAYANAEESPMIDNFSKKEIGLVQDFERYNVFDILSTEEIVERIARRENIYDLIIDFYSRQYSNLDVLLDDPEIQRDLKFAFKNRYKKRLDKIVDGVKTYVGQYGPVIVVTQVERKIWDKIKESEEERRKVSEELERQINELTSRLRPLEEVDEQAESFKQRLSSIETGLVTGAKPEDLGSLESQKDHIINRYFNLEKELSSQVDTINQRRRELEHRETELERARQEYQEQQQEEKRRLVESELSEIAELKSRLLSQEKAFEAERTELKLKGEELADRLKQITDVLQGKPIRFITKEDAKLCELNFIARFETKMESLPLRIYSPIERRTYEVKSWKEETHFKFAQREAPDTPSNARSQYFITERRHLFFGEKVVKVTIEAVSLNHLEEFEKYGFDARRASLADFLRVIARFINTAEIGKYLHVLGIASPTGWDDRVKKEIKSTDFAHNYVSRYVSICLIDSVAGEVIHNPTDERIIKFVEFFQPQFDREKLVKVKEFIRNSLSQKGYAVFSDTVEETDETRTIVNKAFYDLEDEGEGKMRHVKEVGLVLEVRP